MGNDRLIPFSIICLAVSLIISSTIISKAFTKASDSISAELANCNVSISNGLGGLSQAATNGNKLSTYGDVMSIYDAAVYLHIDQDSLRSAIGSTDSGIPYTIIGNNCVFSKKALDKWIEDKIAKENNTK